MGGNSYICLSVALATIFIQIGGTVADEGCNGEFHGIPCCYMGFTTGDNSGGKEIFIQSNEYTEQSCFETCKKNHPTSVGLTESLHQKYTSGNGTNKNKCWCEFGNARLNGANTNYQTCIFETPDALALTKSNPVLKECLSAGGFFFGHAGGRIKVKDNFKVGEHLNIQMWLKARAKDGLLLAVQGPEDYSILELVNGALVFRVDNGDGPIVSRWNPDDNPNKLLEDTCKVEAIKWGKIVQLTVDGVHANVGEEGEATYADTNDALFLGGHSHPQLITDFPGSFEGCIVDVTINNEKLVFSRYVLEGDVHPPTR